MGDRADEVWKHFAHEGPMIYWANIFVTTACLLDYFLSDRSWEIETLAVLIFAINGIALWNRKRELSLAYKREMEDMIEVTRSEAARTERLKSRGLI